MDDFIEQIANAVVEKLTPALKLQAPSNPESDFCNIHRASEITGLAVSTLYIKFSKGQLSTNMAFKRGGRLYFSESGILNWLKSGNDSDE